jgi:ribosomal protein L11 methyltransferase
MTAWQVHVEAPRKAVAALEALFSTLGGADEPPVVMSFEIVDDQLWGIDVVLDEPVDEAALAARVNDTLKRLGMDPAALAVTELAPVDWVAESLKHHQPVSAGRFYVYGSHHPKPALDR